MNTLTKAKDMIDIENKNLKEKMLETRKTLDIK
jgi:hypothetical protein